MLLARRPSSVRWLYPLTITIVFTVGLAATLYLGLTIYQSKRQALESRAQTLAEIIDPADIRSLQGSTTDMGTQTFVRLKNFLASLRSANPDLRFIRLMGLRSDNQVFFYADSESFSASEYVLPGDLYPEATALLRTVLEGGAPIGFERADDEWGRWISAYAPIKSSTGGQPVALVRLDAPYGDFVLEIVRHAAVPLTFTAILLAGLVATHYAWERERRYLEEKDEFITIASHEIRAPLTGLRWATENLLGQPHGTFDSETEKIIKTMHNDAVALAANLNNLIDLTSLDQATLPFALVPVRSIVEQVTKSLALTAASRRVTITIDQSLAPTLQVWGHAETLHHLFANLLGNAVKYTAENTSVHISYARENGWEGISVSDQGPGLSPEEQHTIFGGFAGTRRLKRVNEHGTGIGLYLAERIAELHGGQIGVASVLGHGSTFTVFLPPAAQLS